MQRLIDDFAKLFDLDHRVRGVRLGDLITRTIDEFEEQALPDWGSSGSRDLVASESCSSFDFYYAPHLFPQMDLSLRLAHKLQFHMLPRRVPEGVPMSVSAVLESYCHLSGDLFGWETIADDRFLIWIVDLSGHGVRAGLASAVLKVLIDNLRRRGQVGSLVAELNDNFVGCLREDKDNLFATGFFLAVSGDGSACYTSAGHPPMLVRRADRQIDRLSSNGLPIGMFPDRRYEAADFRLEPGDVLLLYTDGLVETTNEQNEMLGLDRPQRLLQEDGAPRELTRALYRMVAEHQDMDKLDDDVTFVVAKMNPGGKAGA